MKKILLLSLLFFTLLVGFGQIPPGYYNSASGLTGNQLKSALHNIIDNHQEYSYDDLRDFILENTDEDPNNSNNIILLYTGRSQNKNTFGGGANDWNREHVWAKSHGDFGNSPPCGTDAHHIRPTDASVNSSRGNKDFDNGGQQHNEATGCYYDNDSWEARDEVKGDVARMLMYMAVRYEGGSGEPDLELVDWVNTAPNPKHGKFSTLMAWHAFDPPDAFEINRNNVIYSYQGNRNPFIDHPEYVDMLWDTYTHIQLGEKSRLTIYPTLADSFLRVEFNGVNLPEMEIRVVGADGKKYFTNSLVSEAKDFTIDVSNYPSGSYFVHLISRELHETKKVIVKH